MKLIYVLCRRRLVADEFDRAVAQLWCSVIARAARGITEGAAPVSMSVLNVNVSLGAVAKVMVGCDAVVACNGAARDKDLAKLISQAEGLGLPVLNADQFGWCALDGDGDHVEADGDLGEWLERTVAYATKRARA